MVDRPRTVEPQVVLGVTPETEIPESQRDAVGRMARYAPEKRAALLQAIREAPPSQRGSEFAEGVAKLANLPTGEAIAVVQALVSMYVSAETFSDEGGGFVEAVAKAAESLGIEPQEGTWEPFKGWLREVLSVDETLGVTAKALDLATSYKAEFCSVRIITDYRPIFGRDPAAGAKTGVIVHQAKITYHEDQSEDTKEFYVAMDRRDLESLKRAIDRALVKERSLGASLRKGGLVAYDDR